MRFIYLFIYCQFTLILATQEWRFEEDGIFLASPYHSLWGEVLHDVKFNSLGQMTMYMIDGVRMDVADSP